MDFSNHLDFLAPNDIRVHGTRIGIETILHEYLHGQDSMDIVHKYPSLTPAQVHATIAYYFENQESTDAYLSERFEEERLAREEQDRNPSPEVARLRALKHRGTNGSAAQG